MGRAKCAIHPGPGSWPDARRRYPAHVAYEEVWPAAVFAPCLRLRCSNSYIHREHWTTSGLGQSQRYHVRWTLGSLRVAVMEHPSQALHKAALGGTYWAARPMATSENYMHLTKSYRMPEGWLIQADDTTMVQEPP